MILDGGTSGLPLAPYLKPLGRNFFRLNLISATGHYGEIFPQLNAQLADMPIENNSDTQELISLIGEDAFTRLCMVFGGTRLHITNSERSLQRLSVIIGSDLAKKLISHCQGESISIPKLSGLEIAKRHQSVVSDLEKGMSQRDVALKYDMTERNVRIIKVKHLK